MIGISRLAEKAGRQCNIQRGLQNKDRTNKGTTNIRSEIYTNCKPHPIARKTSVFLALESRKGCVSAISKKTRQEKQDKVVTAILSFLIKDLKKIGTQPKRKSPAIAQPLADHPEKTLINLALSG